MSAMNGGRPDVLVVNRDRLICLTMAKKLRRLGYSVIPTSSYYEARRVLSSNFPRLLIADVRLEQFNGLNLAWHRELTIPGPSIITDVVHDALLQAEAGKVRASYFLLPTEEQAVIARAVAVLGAPRAMAAKSSSLRAHKFAHAPVH